MTQIPSSQDKKFTFDEFHAKYVAKFSPQSYLFSPTYGFIVWRLGTGENVELLHIRVFKSGQGHGTKLISAMINELKKNPPFYSIFGFTLKSNTAAITMYKKAGFNIAECPFPYKGGPATVFSQSFEELCLMEIHEKTNFADLMINVVKSNNL